MNGQNATPACCLDRANRRLVEISTQSAADGVTVRKKEQCSVCGRNHYTMSVPPVELNLAGAPV